MAANYGKDVYKWRWDSRVRQLFNLRNPGPDRRRRFTNEELNVYVAQLNAIETEYNDPARRGRVFTDDMLEPKVVALAVGLGYPAPPALGDIPRRPGNAGEITAALNAIYPTANMPPADALEAARRRVGLEAVARVAAPAAPAAPRGRPNIADAAAVVDPQPLTSVVLPAGASQLFTYINESDVRNLTRELSDLLYNPEQTTKVTITPPGGAAIQNVDVTPLQYAALAGLKGVVRLLLNKSVSDVSKKINNLTVGQAIEQYRSNDVDKNEVKRIFQIVDTAVKDAVEDFTEGNALDSKYGDRLTKDTDKKLAKIIYEREYKELESPKSLSVTAPKTTSRTVEEAKKKGKEDGGIGSSMNPEYATKTPQEKEGYGKEYDKARAKFQGEKDGVMGETGGITNIENELSEYYTGPNSVPAHIEEVKKIYNDIYDANKDKTVDIAKESGYVAKYLTIDSISGNYFGFGSELNKIIGFDSESSETGKESENKYQEGLAEFLKEYKTLIGQAKYSGYMDGRNKNAKYTSLGKITVSGKQYAVDFGKLNTTIKTQPELDATSRPVENPEYNQASYILNRLSAIKNDTELDIPDMIDQLSRQLSRPEVSDKIKQVLQPIISSQRGGGQVGGATREEVIAKIDQLTNEETKNTLLRTINREGITQQSINNVNDLTDIYLRWQTSTGRVDAVSNILARPLGPQVDEEELERAYAELGEQAGDAPVGDAPLEAEAGEAPAEETAEQKFTRIKNFILGDATANLEDGRVKDAVLRRITNARTRENLNAAYIRYLNTFKTQIGSLILRLNESPEKNQLVVRWNSRGNMRQTLLQLRTDVNAVLQSQQRERLAREEQERAARDAAQRVQTQKDGIKIKIDRLLSSVSVGEFNRRLETAGENLGHLETAVDAEIARLSGLIRTKIDALPDGTRKTDFNNRMIDDNLASIDQDVNKSSAIITEINKIQNDQTKNLLLQVFNELNQTLDKVEKDVNKEVVKQERNITKKKALIQKQIKKVTNDVVKQTFTDRVSDPGVSIDQLDTLLPEIQRELHKQKIQEKINTIPDGAVKTAFETRLNTAGENFESLENDATNWTYLNSEIKRQLWYVPDTEAGKAGFLGRVNDPSITLDQLTALLAEIKPVVPSWARIAQEKTVNFGRAVGSLASRGLSTAATGMRTVGTAASTGATAVGRAAATGATAVGTAAATGATAVGQAVTTGATAATQAASLFGTNILKNLGSVSSKQQLYEKVKQALSVIPKYTQVKVEPIPAGRKPDDPSLGVEVNVPLRLQKLYDSEFDRGVREGSRKAGGTKRRTRSNQRTTKKTRSTK